MENNDKLSKNVLLLGWISLLNDLGSEVLNRLVPLYVAGVLGAPMSAVGLIEGLAESGATLLKPIFGAWSDRLRRRKVFVIFGYALSAIARPLLAFTGAWPEVAFLRLCDRLGKGVRTAPRDALIAESGTPSTHGRNFGLERSLDTLGALLGVAGFGLWTWTHGETQLTARTWVGLAVLCGIPGFIALALAASGIRETVAKLKSPPASGTKLHSTLKRYLIVIAIFSLANSSDAFILLRAKELQFTLAEILGTIALLNLVSAMTSIPAAALSDRFGRRTLIILGWIIYAVAYFLIGHPGIAESKLAFAAVVGVYGLFFGFTESVEKAWIADLSSPEEKGRAYGIFAFVVGAVALPASLGFGWVWDHFGSQVAFTASAAIAMFSIALLFLLVDVAKKENAPQIPLP